jgi:hypothetical protein
MAINEGIRRIRIVGMCMVAASICLAVLAWALLGKESAIIILWLFVSVFLTGAIVWIAAWVVDGFYKPTEKTSQNR